MVKEYFTGIIVPMGLNLPDNYECGDVWDPSNCNPEKLWGCVLDINVGGSGKNVDEVVEKLKRNSAYRVRIMEQNGSSWPTSEMKKWREYLNFVRSEYVEARWQVPIINEKVRLDGGAGVAFNPISLSIYDLTRYNVGRASKDPLEVD
jgi:hypothetical protein